MKNEVIILYLKNITIIYIVAIFLISAKCSAAVSEYAIDTAKQTLNNTEGFEYPITHGDYEGAKALSNQYQAICDDLDLYLKKNKKNMSLENYNCIELAYSIANLRCLVLTEYIMSVQIYQKNGKSAFYDEMINEMYSDWRKAISRRQQFHKKYGF